MSLVVARKAALAKIDGQVGGGTTQVVRTTELPLSLDVDAFAEAVEKAHPDWRLNEAAMVGGKQAPDGQPVVPFAAKGRRDGVTLYYSYRRGCYRAVWAGCEPVEV